MPFDNCIHAIAEHVLYIRRSNFGTMNAWTACPRWCTARFNQLLTINCTRQQLTDEQTFGGSIVDTTTQPSATRESIFIKFNVIFVWIDFGEMKVTVTCMCDQWLRSERPHVQPSTLAMAQNCHGQCVMWSICPCFYAEMNTEHVITFVESKPADTVPWDTYVKNKFQWICWNGHLLRFGHIAGDRNPNIRRRNCWSVLFRWENYYAIGKLWRQRKTEKINIANWTIKSANCVY